MVISVSDERVLEALFDPESSPSAGIKIDDSLSADPYIRDQNTLSSLRTQEASIISKIESFDKLEKQDAGVSASRKQIFDDSVRQLDDLIREQPTYASAYNNRAQVLRWYYDSGSASDIPTPEIEQGLQRAMQDLTKAISLASPGSPTAAVSPAQARLLAQSHTQRGTLYLSLSLTETASAKKAELEEKSAADFMMGGKFGNRIGKQMGVKMNPYARLCGEIVREAMKNELETFR